MCLTPAAIVARYKSLMRVRITKESAIHADEVSSYYGPPRSSSRTRTGAGSRSSWTLTMGGHPGRPFPYLEEDADDARRFLYGAPTATISLVHPPCRRADVVLDRLPGPSVPQTRVRRGRRPVAGRNRRGPDQPRPRPDAELPRRPGRGRPEQAAAKLRGLTSRPGPTSSTSRSAAMSRNRTVGSPRPSQVFPAA